MSTIAYQITSLTIVYSNAYSSHRWKKTSKLCVTDLCEGNSPMTGEFRAQMTRLLGGEFTGDRWIPDIKGQSREKRFHLMTSSLGCPSVSSSLTLPPSLQPPPPLQQRWIIKEWPETRKYVCLFYDECLKCDLAKLLIYLKTPHPINSDK